MFLVLFMAGKRIILNRWDVDVSCCGGGGDDVCCIFALCLQLHLGQENEKMKTLGFWYCSAAVGFAGTNEEKNFFLGLWFSCKFAFLGSFFVLLFFFC